MRKVTTWVSVIFFHQTSSGLIGAISISGESSLNSWKGFSRVGMNGLAGFKGALEVAPKGLAAGLANATFADGPVSAGARVGGLCTTAEWMDGFPNNVAANTAQRLFNSYTSDTQRCVDIDIVTLRGLAVKSIAMTEAQARLASPFELLLGFALPPVRSSPASFSEENESGLSKSGTAARSRFSNRFTWAAPSLNLRSADSDGEFVPK